MAELTQVGVTGNARRWSPSWWCLALALRMVKARPIRISTRLEPSDDFAPDALIISGGDDISPELYGGEITLKSRIDPKRDQLEMRWIERALEEGIPLLGICRGAQLINVVLGGTLHPDIRRIRKKTYNRPGLMPTKQVRLDKQSTIARICRKTKLRVNSLHYQAIKEPGRGVRVVGWDLDDITQAVESDNALVVGVQWHPEYLFYLPSQLRLLRWLTSARSAGARV